MSRKDRKFKRFFRQKVGDLQKKKKKKKRSSLKFRVIFRPKSKIQTFFPPKIKWSPKKKKKKVFAKIQGDFSSKISQVQTFQGGLFSHGGSIFNFSQKIGLKSTKNMRFCILLKTMGGALAPPAPPGYATAYNHLIFTWQGLREGGTSYLGSRLGGPGLKGPGKVQVSALSFGIAP